MIRAIVQFSLRYRAVVLILACVTIVYGIHVTMRAKLDVFPDFVPPQVTIQTEAPGMSPEDVEELVTRPVETALIGAGNQESIRSESIQGLSIITVVFKEGANVLFARQQIAEKLAELAGKLPAGLPPPRMSPLVSSTMDLLKIGLLSTNQTPMQLRTFADWTLKPRLLSVPGVARANVFGGEVRQLQIKVIPDKLIAYNLALSEVLNAARLSTGVRGGGFIETASQRILIRADAQALSVEALGNIIINANTNNVPIRLRDVANVVEGAEPKVGDTIINGQPGVLLTMSSQPGANTLEVTRAVEATIDELQPLFEREGIRLVPALHRPATFVETSLRNIEHSLYLGAIFVAIVLFLFLGRVRITVISLTAIPLSLLTAIVILDALGISLNTITLGGLAVAIGEVVDDAIIDVENILRRLRENAALAHPRSTFDVIFDASLEVRKAVVFATFIVALVFLPILALSGLQGSFFSPLAISYILAILASLAVALTITPALCYLFFDKGVGRATETGVQKLIRRSYARLLEPANQAPNLLLTAALLLCALIFCTIPFLEGEFLPQFREGHYVLQVSTGPGASIQETLRIGKIISDRILAIPNVSTIEQQVGRAELGEDAWPPHRSEFHVELKPVSGAEQAKVESQIRAILTETPGIQSEVMTFLGDRISESISGETAPVVVNLFGDDLAELDARAEDIASALKSIKDAADVIVKAPPGAPAMMIRLRPERVAELGFRPVEVLEAIQTAYQGTAVAQVFRANQITDVVVILDDALRNDPRQIGSFLIRNQLGAIWRLQDVAKIYPAETRSSILHEGARRRQTITCNPSGDLDAFVAAAKKEIAAKVKLPRGYYTEFSGAAEQAAKARREILVNSGLAAIGILLLLSLVLRSGRNLLLVLTNLPFALVGGILALHVARLFGAEDVGLSMGAIVGFVTLFGITVRNSIMLISHYDHLVTLEGAAWNIETAIRGASERVIPILMTAAVTGLGLLPLALGSGEAGREIEGPMAIVILGGLITSTLLNLLVLPSLAARYARFNTAQT
ncbi:MAG TPA: efflux RND transporter permease subunit [Verrucomicrobiae bacterium]|nr:efflux RND transporter permease subunit [Verrucomicrobiae bacterium]